MGQTSRPTVRSTFGSPREIVDWPESHLSNQRADEKAAAFLRKLAQNQNNHELAEGLEGKWRRERIAALVREVFRE